MTGIVTVPVGCELSFTVKVAVPLFSVVFPEMADTVKPELSLSEIVTVAVLGIFTV